MINRRNFLSNLVFGASTLMTDPPLKETFKLGGKVDQSIFNQTSLANRYDLMKEVMKYRKIDAHIHVYWAEDYAEELINFVKSLNVDKLVLSRYLNVMPGTPDQFRKFNDLTIKTMRKYPDHFLGGFVLNPAYEKESLEEIDRCIDAGMIGTGELYYQVKINDPRYYPIIEKLIDLKMIIHSHAECQMGVGGYRMKYKTNKQPNTSIPEDFVDVAKRYPEGIFQYAHIGMGGDWEYECKMFRGIPNIYVDTGGSNNAEGMIDFAVQHLGEDRVFFASDNAYYQSVGKILASNLTDRQKQKIFFDNYNNLLKRGGRSVD